MASHQESVVRREKQKCLGLSHTAGHFMTRRKGIFDSRAMEKSGNLYCYPSASLGRSSGVIYLGGSRRGSSWNGVEGGRTDWGTQAPYCESL